MRTRGIPALLRRKTRSDAGSEDQPRPPGVRKPHRRTPRRLDLVLCGRSPRHRDWWSLLNQRQSRVGWAGQLAGYWPLLLPLLVEMRRRRRTVRGAVHRWFRNGRTLDRTSVKMRGMHHWVVVLYQKLYGVLRHATNREGDRLCDCLYVQAIQDNTSCTTK
ncbi:hypothetical protein EI94DRAFT_1722143 [Lactarius quietus]|nr:hypothetical protein EI94DRAFT_1722143 [Lactarius quietus]